MCSVKFSKRKSTDQKFQQIKQKNLSEINTVKAVSKKLSNEVKDVVVQYLRELDPLFGQTEY